MMFVSHLLTNQELTSSIISKTLPSNAGAALNDDRTTKPLSKNVEDECKNNCCDVIDKQSKCFISLPNNEISSNSTNMKQSRTSTVHLNVNTNSDKRSSSMYCRLDPSNNSLPVLDIRKQNDNQLSLTSVTPKNNNTIDLTNTISSVGSVPRSSKSSNQYDENGDELMDYSADNLDDDDDTAKPMSIDRFLHLVIDQYDKNFDKSRELLASNYEKPKYGKM